ncbi:MAG TPA: ferritin-like domain-containing protein [Polyangiaceae bacterium]|nr:ferritin-like domain-containing protein [Polyangiaceae bacterium]
MADYHEPWEALSPQARDLHRALTSLKEEIEAVDWYNQRVELATDPELKQVLAHNRDEEIEHACMTLEWLRRKMGKWDENLRTYLFNDSPITEAEERDKTAEGEKGTARSLGIGSLKERKDR